jgi:hypothetical protein
LGALTGFDEGTLKLQMRRVFTLLAFWENVDLIIEDLKILGRSCIIF